MRARQAVPAARVATRVGIIAHHRNCHPFFVFPLRARRALSTAKLTPLANGRPEEEESPLPIMATRTQEDKLDGAEANLELLKSEARVLNSQIPRFTLKGESDTILQQIKDNLAEQTKLKKAIRGLKAKLSATKAADDLEEKLGHAFLPPRQEKQVRMYLATHLDALKSFLALSDAEMIHKFAHNVLKVPHTATRALMIPEGADIQLNTADVGSGGVAILFGFTMDGAPMAVKLFENAESFEKEAAVVADVNKLHNDFLLRYRPLTGMKVGHKDGIYDSALVSPKWECLSHYHAPLNVRTLENIARCGMKGLTALWDAGYCHCDIKPQNMFCAVVDAKHCRFLIGDFGSCRKLTEFDIDGGGFTPSFWPDGMTDVKDGKDFDSILLGKVLLDLHDNSHVIRTARSCRTFLSAIMDRKVESIPRENVSIVE